MIKLFDKIFSEKKTKSDKVIFIQSTLMSNAIKQVFEYTGSCLNIICFNECNSIATRLNQNVDICIAAKILTNREHFPEVIHIVLFDNYADVKQYTDRVKILVGVSKIHIFLDTDIDSVIHAPGNGIIIHYTSVASSIGVIQELWGLKNKRRKHI